MSEYVINININGNARVGGKSPSNDSQNNTPQKEKAEKKKLIGTSQAVALKTIAVAGFVYNYTIATTRFGQRGQDIQDQQALQDKYINTGLGLAAATIVNPVAGAVALGYTILNEIISVSKENAAYNYQKNIDSQQTAVFSERVGREVYNSSRR